MEKYTLGERKKMLDSKKKQIFIFAIVSGCFLMSMNAVTIIIPLRMTDMGLNYSEIGGIMSAFSLGILGIKIITGRHADIVGQKKVFVSIPFVRSYYFNIYVLCKYNVAIFSFIMLFRCVSWNFYFNKFIIYSRFSR